MSQQLSPVENVLRKAKDDLWRGPETLSPLKMKMAYQRPSSPYVRVLGLVGSCGLGDGSHTKERLFQEPQDRKEKNEEIPRLGTSVWVICCYVSRITIHSINVFKTSWEEFEPCSVKQRTPPGFRTPIFSPDFLLETVLNWETWETFEAQETDRQFNT